MIVIEGCAIATVDDARREIGSLATSEEDVVSYALFPDLARAFFESRGTT